MANRNDTRPYFYYCVGMQIYMIEKDISEVVYDDGER